MPATLQAALDRLAHAADLFVGEATSADVPLLVLGALLALLASAVRTRGWHTIIRAAYPDAHALRARDTAKAFLAGSGLNAVIPARGGDVVKLALVRKRIPEGRWSTLAGTFVPETLFETVLGTCLVAWALAKGFLPVPSSPGFLDSIDVSFVLAHPLVSLAIAATLGGLGVALRRWARRTGADVLHRFRDGMTILGSPRRFLVGVASWQALSRVIRLGSLACFMAAFDLPVTIETVVLVMAAQGGGRIIPIAPVSTGLRLVMLLYGFVEVTGEAVGVAQITAFTFGMGAVLLVSGLTVSLAILASEMGTRSPRKVWRDAYRMRTVVPTGTRL